MALNPRQFPCNTCNLSFPTSELQHSHMRQDWHVSNVRRRIVGLPALSEDEYIAPRTSPRIVIQPMDRDEAVVKQPSSEARTEVMESHGYQDPPMECLFCNLTSITLESNIDHMSITHGLFIPSVDKLSDLESFLGYLATIIYEYNECLYCGLAKSSTDGIQAHMRDKGHCMLNLDAQSELLDFWDVSDGSDGDDNGLSPSAAIKLSTTEMRLPSGAIISSRSDTTQLRVSPGLAQSRTKNSQHRIKRDETRATITAESHNQDAGFHHRQSSHAHSHDNRIAIRGELGLTGLPESMKRALMISEKKMKRREAIAKTANRHAMEQQPRKAIYYKTENPVYQAG